MKFQKGNLKFKKSSKMPMYINLWFKGTQDKENVP